jgi:outer membrane receptor protein involved in Fe transport
LKAETARTFTVGLVAQPIDRLSLTIDYYDIDIKDAIGVFGGGAQFVVVGCIFGGADPADPLCQAYNRGEEGFVTELFAPNANLARLRSSGIDWQLSYSLPLLSGQLQLNLSGTRLLRSEVQVNSNLDAIRCEGSFGVGTPCGITINGTATPKWKLFNRASWDLGPVAFSLRHRYFSSTKDAYFAMFEMLKQPPPTNIPVNATWMQSRHYFDAAATFDIADRFGLTLGVNNIFDTKPSLVGSAQIQANTDPSLYDVLGRRFFATVRAKIR